MTHLQLINILLATALLIATGFALWNAWNHEKEIPRQARILGMLALFSLSWQVFFSAVGAGFNIIGEDTLVETRAVFAAQRTFALVMLIWASFYIVQGRKMDK